MKIKNEEYPIDIVIPWVDGCDPAWQKERDRYVSREDRNNKSTGGDERYLDDGLLLYIFRGIEKYVPWVNKVHFITWGHLPKWLNINHPKINIVKHDDFIPKKYLPTFNTNPIVLNLHRIPTLSNHFIFANDDTYFLSPLKRKDFFRKGLPCDMAVQETLEADVFQDAFNSILINDLCLLNKTISKKSVQKKYLFKWLNLKYGLKHLLKNILLFPFTFFSGIYEPHIPAPYLKSSFEELWQRYYREFDSVCSHKVRSTDDCNEYLMRYYQLCKGRFVPFNRDRIGIYSNMNSNILPKIIREQRKKMVCINYYDEKNFQAVKSAFDHILGDKCSYEL